MYRISAEVCDKNHSNNLFSERNSVFLAMAEALNGKSLSRGDLPHLVCRSCSRKFTNIKLFQDKIRNSQALFESKVTERFKQCVEISPSAPRTIKSLKNASASVIATATSRRELDFSASSQHNIVSVFLSPRYIRKEKVNKK